MESIRWSIPVGVKHILSVYFVLLIEIFGFVYRMAHLQSSPVVNKWFLRLQGANTQGQMVPSHRFAHELGLVRGVPKEEQTAALQAQVAIARRRNVPKWLSQVAKDLYGLGLYDYEWICGAIVRFQKPSVAKCGARLEYNRDVRLETNPGIEHHVFDAGTPQLKVEPVKDEASSVLVESTPLESEEEESVLDLGVDDNLSLSVEEDVSEEMLLAEDATIATVRVECSPMKKGANYSPIRWASSTKKTVIEVAPSAEGGEVSVSPQLDSSTAVECPMEEAVQSPQTVVIIPTDPPLVTLPVVSQSAEPTLSKSAKARKQRRLRQNRQKRAKETKQQQVQAVHVVSGQEGDKVDASVRGELTEPKRVKPGNSPSVTFSHTAWFGHTENRGQGRGSEAAASRKSAALVPEPRPEGSVANRRLGLSSTSNPCLLILGRTATFGKRKATGAQARWLDPELTVSGPRFADSQPEGPAAKKVKLGKPCPIAGCLHTTVSTRRLHAFDEHLPELFGDRSGASMAVARKRQEALLWLARRVLGKEGSIVRLARLMVVTRVLEGLTNEVTPGQRSAMVSLCECMGIAQPAEFTFVPLSSPAALLHWMPLLLIMSRVSPSTQKEFRELYATLPPQESPASVSTGVTGKGDGVTVSDVVVGLLKVGDKAEPEAFDSHFHLDRLRTMLKLPSSASLQDALKMVLAEESHRVHLVGVVANFCDPPTWPTGQDVMELGKQGIRVAIGFHPKKAAQCTDELLARFKYLLQLPGVVGFGEIGVDHSDVNPTKWSNQIALVNQLLPYLRLDHVLIIHCRGMNNQDSSEAYLSCMFQLQAERVSPNQRIHVHCFNCTEEMAKKWLGVFPRTMFGFTAMVGSFTRLQKQALVSMEQKHILLETDAPYFPPRGRHVSAPSLVGDVAQLVAKIRGETFTQVLAYTTANAKQHYSLSESEAKVG
jgi:Tat protein secretion system quality control protein TatD with DNase activity